MSRAAYLHEVDLGPWLSDADIALHLSQGREQPALRAVLQFLRNRAAAADRDGRFIPAGAHPGDHRAFQDGGAEALEAAFWDIVQMQKSELDKELEEEAKADES